MNFRFCRTWRAPRVFRWAAVAAVSGHDDLRSTAVRPADGSQCLVSGHWSAAASCTKLRKRDAGGDFSSRAVISFPLPSAGPGAFRAGPARHR
jgi:hypothetical protein